MKHVFHRALLPLLAATLLLQACATPEVEPAPAEAEYVPAVGITDRERFRTVLQFLAQGNTDSARAELTLYLDEHPDSEIALDLLTQIDTPAQEYFPAEYEQLTMESGDSLSTLSQKYLGSVYKFHALAKYNGIDVPSKMTAGQTVRIPLTPEAVAAFAVPEPSAVEAGTLEPNDGATDGVADLQPELTEPPLADQVETTEPLVSQDSEVESRLARANAESLHRSALNAYRAQDLDKAIVLWDEVLEIEPEHENARLYRAQAIELKKKLSDLL